MKKIIYSSLIISALSLVTSCNENLLDNFTPDAQTEEVALTKSSDLQMLMNAAMNTMSNRTETVFNSVFTDECGVGFANGGQGIYTDFAFFLNPISTGPSTIWVNSYEAISRLNRVIAYADIIKPVDDADKLLIARTKAEALSLRAYLHLKLLSYFTTDMKDDNALSAMKSDKIFLSTETDHPRITNGEMYAFIHSDLDAALAIFDTSGLPVYDAATNISTYYPSKVFAQLIKARAYTFKGNYTSAELWADKVINESGFSLQSGTNYTNAFWTDTEPNKSEVIFRLRRTLPNSSQATNLGNGYASLSSTVNGSPFYEIGRALFNKIPSNDVRYSTIVHTSSVIDPNYATSANYLTTDKLILGKHRGNSSRGVLNVDFKLARTVEAYFIKAEARVSAGDLTGSGTVLKKILDKRFTAAQTVPSFANSQAAWTYILNQRRIEFAFEGYRFIDLKRLKDATGAGIDRDAADYASYPSANPVNFPNNSNKWALPIPQEELIVNKAIVSQQNPGY